MDPDQHVQLAAEGQVNAAGEFEILAITAGQGNGWTFGAPVLQASLPLWEHVETFVDHGELTSDGHSLRDLGGVCHTPAWDESDQGIRLRLRTTGPSGPLVEALGREMLADAPHKPRVGFSADVIFQADAARVVQKILRVLSLDLVFHPARGGAFIRALNSVQPIAAQETPMPEPSTTPPGAATAAPPAATAAADLEAMRTLLAVNSEQQRAAREAEAALAVRVQMCSYLLDSGLAASRLPAPAQDAIRKRFAHNVFEPKDLTAAIDDQRA